MSMEEKKVIKKKKKKKGARTAVILALVLVSAEPSCGSRKRQPERQKQTTRCRQRRQPSWTSPQS